MNHFNLFLHTVTQCPNFGGIGVVLLLIFVYFLNAFFSHVVENKSFTKVNDLSGCSVKADTTSEGVDVNWVGKLSVLIIQILIVTINYWVVCYELKGFHMIKSSFYKVLSLGLQCLLFSVTLLWSFLPYLNSQTQSFNLRVCFTTALSKMANVY